jgi:hypothetical protein
MLIFVSLAMEYKIWETCLLFVTSSFTEKRVLFPFLVPCIQAAELMEFFSVNLGVREADHCH